MKKELIEKYIVAKHIVTKYRITLEPNERYCKTCCEIHRGKAPNFCPDCGSSLSDNFVLYEKVTEELKGVNNELGN